jgi:hypothetical protein
VLGLGLGFFGGAFNQMGGRWGPGHGHGMGADAGRGFPVGTGKGRRQRRWVGGNRRKGTEQECGTGNCWGLGAWMCE